MKSTNFDYTGGFPLEQPVLKRMQEATFELLRAFARHIGCADVGNYIISGCVVAGGNITPGIMYIDGELCPFAGVAGTNATKIKKQTYTTNAAFENGTNPPVFIETLAVVDATGTEIGSFVRFNFVQDANYVHTDNNFTAALLAKLLGIEAGAQVNVQTDWDVVSPSSAAYLKNKPTGIFAQVERVPFLGMTDIDGSGVITIPIPNMSSTNYFVAVTIESTSLNTTTARNNATFAYAIFNKQTTSFQFAFREFIGLSQQSLKIEFLIFKQ